MLIRASVPDEADAVAEVFLASRAAAAEAGRIPPIVGTEQSVRGFIRRSYDDHDITVAVEGHQVVAMLITSPGWLNHLYVLPDHTGRGLGSRLVDHAKAGSSGLLELWAFQANDLARRFYEHHGFQPVEFTDGATNIEQAPDVRYIWLREPSETHAG